MREQRAITRGNTSVPQGAIVGPHVYIHSLKCPLMRPSSDTEVCATDERVVRFRVAHIGTISMSVVQYLGLLFFFKYVCDMF